MPTERVSGVYLVDSTSEAVSAPAVGTEDMQQADIAELPRKLQPDSGAGQERQSWLAVELLEILVYISDGALPEDGRRAWKIVLQRLLFAVVGGPLCYVDPVLCTVIISTLVVLLLTCWPRTRYSLLVLSKNG